MGLGERVVELEALVAERERALAERDAVIVELRSRIEELEKRLGRDSSNSSTPPSRDKTDRRERRAAEREERRAKHTGDGKARRPGKQPGSPGSTLERRRPDATIGHVPARCRCCGESLADAPVVSTAVRQVIEVPEPKAVVTDHVAERRRCGWGTETTAEFPSEAAGPVCWGPRAKAVAAYLMGRQHLPLERAAEAMKVLFDAGIGEGTLAGILPDAAGRLEPFTAELMAALGDAPVVHADETSVRVGVGLAWVHTISTPWLTLLAARRGRGIDAIIDIGVLNNHTGTIVHDGLATYDTDTFANASHAQCCAHLLRYLDTLAKFPDQRAWATAMRDVLIAAKQASETAAADGAPKVADHIAGPIRYRYDRTLVFAFAGLPHGPPPRRKHRDGWTNTEREAWNLATRMRAAQDQVLRLLDDTRVPFDNNEAERSLRMAKLHDKISGAFRSMPHAQAFMTVRSYLQTGAKHGHNALHLLTALWTTGPWLPTVTKPATN